MVGLCGWALRAIALAISDIECAKARTVRGPGRWGASGGVEALEARVFLDALSFDGVRAFETGRSPWCVTVGDFNGDGNADLATASASDGTVSILLGRGDGTFHPKADYAAGDYGASFVALGDFNGDGKSDLAVANFFYSDSTVSILLGNGDGTFQAKIDYAVGSNPSSIAVGDLNGDGKSDLAVTNGGTYPGYGNTVSVLLGKGDGSFQAKTDYTVGTNPMCVTLGDFNGDGKKDLAVANKGSSNVSILLGNGDGSFQAKNDYAAGDYPTSVAVGDLNGDGKSDLAVANDALSSLGAVSVLLGKGDGSFQPQTLHAAGTVSGSVAIGDFNNDGMRDLAVANSSGSLGYTVSILLGNGDGTFQAKRDCAAADGPGSLVVADFNGDGNSDVAVANPPLATVSILLGKGDGSFHAKSGYTVDNYPTSIAVGSFNSDGTRDLAVANYGSNTVSILLGNVDGSFLASTDYVVGRNPMSVAVGDFNGDGKSDLATANNFDNTVSILLGNGDGTFQAKHDYAAGQTPRLVTAGDFNGDGKTDLVVDGATILLGNGNGTFQAGIPTGVFGPSVTVADFNGDGKSDLAVGDDSESVRVVLGKGDGTFQTESALYVGYHSKVTAADFNGDGKTDLAVANDDGGSGYWLSMFLGNGDGTFQARADYATGYVPESIAVADFDGDGKKDVAVANSLGSSGHTVSLLVGNGDGSFQPRIDYAVGTYPRAVTAADFNGDGRSDLAVGNYNSYAVSLLLNTTVPSSNHAPTDIALSNASVAENLPAGTLVGTLSATDPDAGDTATYSLVAGNGSAGNASFVIDGATLKTAAVFSYAGQSTYSIRVRATDWSGLSYDKVLTISVTNVSEVPAAWMINGTAGDDTITLDQDGANYQLVVNGVASTKSIALVSSITIGGLDGNDTVIVGSSVLMGTTINGGAGNDSLTGGSGADLISGGSGVDTISGGTGADTLIGNGGSDLINGGGGADSILGGGGLDTLNGNAGPDCILGAAGADLINGGGGLDLLNGGGGDDTIYGGAGADTIVGGAGNDLVYGGGGDDWIYVDDGAVISFHDTVYGGVGTNHVDHDSADSVFDTYVDILG